MALRGGMVLAASVCLLAAPAAAKETHRLAYVREPGTEECPDEAAFRAAVFRKLERDPFGPDAPDLLKVVLSRPNKETIHAKLIVQPASGPESITEPSHHSCEATHSTES